jgi:hypothetical protein
MLGGGLKILEKAMEIYRLAEDKDREVSFHEVMGRGEVAKFFE